MRDVDEHAPCVERAHELPSPVSQTLVLVDGGRAAETAAVVPCQRHEPHTGVICLIERALPLGQQLRTLDGEERRRFAAFCGAGQLLAAAAQRQPVRVRRKLRLRGLQHAREALVLRRVEQAGAFLFLRLRRICAAEQREKLHIMLVSLRRCAVDMQIVLAQVLSCLAAFIQGIAVKIKQFHSYPPNAFSIWRMRGAAAPSSP